MRKFQSIRKQIRFYSSESEQIKTPVVTPQPNGIIHSSFREEAKEELLLFKHQHNQDVLNIRISLCIENLKWEVSIL